VWFRGRLSKLDSCKQFGHGEMAADGDSEFVGTENGGPKRTRTEKPGLENAGP